MTQWERKEKRICEYERLRLKEILTRELYTSRLIDQRTSKEQSNVEQVDKTAYLL